MDFLAHIVFFILGAYLSFTNTLALEVTSLLPSATEALYSSESLDSKGNIVYINSKSKFGSIPDILLKNADYQNAAVVESIDPSDGPATALEALVNIYCTYRTEEYIKTTTGTGFFVDTDGVILTNAHVAQFLLLEGIVGDAECIVRTGNPAVAAYEVDLLYISPAWVREHANLINDASPKGTGERDYALLYVTEGVDNVPMPSKFNALPFASELIQTDVVDTEVYATGYPAEALLSQSGQAELIPKQATTTIAELMTFGSNYVDVFTIRGTAIGEHGSSGGPVVNTNGNVIGIISTRGNDELYGEGSLRAISISYIDRTITEETGFSLIRNVGGNLPYRAQLFKQTLVPFLQMILANEL